MGKVSDIYYDISILHLGNCTLEWGDHFMWKIAYEPNSVHHPCLEVTCYIHRFRFGK